MDQLEDKLVVGHFRDKFAISDIEPSSQQQQVKRKITAKQAKKERKLLYTFVQKILGSKVDPDVLKELNRPICFEVAETCRNLLVDNRDYQVRLSTEELLNFITEIGHQLVDCFVLPTKTWFLLRFTDNESLISFKSIILDGNSSTGISQISTVSDRAFDLTVQLYQPEVNQILEAFNPSGYPNGLSVLEDFISVEEEEILIRFAEQCFEPSKDTNHVSRLKNRQAVHFGHVFDYTRNTINSESTDITVQDTSLPCMVQPILERFLARELIPKLPDQLTINRYRGGAQADHIPAHVDTHSMCTEWIVSVSVGSSTVMSFSNPRAKTSSSCLRLVSLPTRSAMVMRKEARYLWRHGISQTAVDMRPLIARAPSSVVNTPLAACADASKRLSLAPRALRYSFTFREVRPPGYRCDCAFPESCDVSVYRDDHITPLANHAATLTLPKQSQTPKVPIQQKPPSSETNNEPISASRAIQLEHEFVHQTYDQIASHFSATRYGQWPEVVQFLSSLPDGSLVFDVGCGNGKYLSVQPQRLLMIGSDRSKNLLDICTQRGFETFQDDVLTIGETLRSEIADGIICIAVIHHLATEERRLAAVKSLIRLLVPGGRALIYVWAFEQKKDGSASKYLKGKRSEDEVNGEANGGEEKTELSVHTNRTQFKKQDLFVPWKQSNGSAKKKKDVEVEQCPAKEETPSTALRFYHVFVQGELETLLSKLDDLIQVEQIYYDQGNWCAIFRKR